MYRKIYSHANSIRVLMMMMMIADGPHHYRILPVVTKDLPISPRFTPCIFFIAMQVQHSSNSSTNNA